MTQGPILIVDDDLDIREILAETLKDFGFEALTATNGSDALRLLRTTGASPSAILLDLMMPVMDGYGFLEERRKDATLAAVPVAIVTAGPAVDRARVGEDIPIVRKPMDLPTLLGVLEDLGVRAGTPP